MNTLFSNFNNRIKKCSHNLLTEKLLLIRRAYFYCYKCGKLIIVKNLKMYESITEGKLEFNPIKVINRMLSNQELINNKDNNRMHISDIYIKNRDIFIHYIKQFCRKINYSKSIFYICLHLMDYYLIHEIKREMTKRTIALITLGFFLIAAKFNENDIYEPKLNLFCKIDKDIVISKKEIINSEIKVLKMMDYNLINYSVYDWLKILNKVGYVFDGRIYKLKFEQIKDKQKLLLRRIIHSDVLYRYDSFKIALSIIHISMDNIFYSDKTSKELFELFLTIFSKKFSDYESCYIAIKIYIFNDFNQAKNEDEKNSINLNKIEKDKSQSKKIIYLLNSMVTKNRNKSKITKNEKVLNVLRKHIQNDEYKINSNIENYYISKLNTINQKPNSYSNVSKDFLSSFSSTNNNKHLTIDCSNNNIDSNTNLINKPQNQIRSNYFNSDNNIINFRLNSDINNLLKKSRTSLSNSPYEIDKNKTKEENKITLRKNLENMIKNKNIIKNFGIKLKNESKSNYNNFMSIKGSMKLICKKNQIKNFILKKDGFINWKEGKSNSIQKNIFNNNTKENKTIAILNKNRTNTFFPKFNK